VKLLGLFNTVTSEELEAARVQALRYLGSMEGQTVEDRIAPADPVRRAYRPRLIAVAAILVLGIFTAAVLNNWLSRTYAVVEAADGGLYRVAGGDVLHAGDTINAGEAVRTNGGVGSVLKLSDGSSVEMRSKSELSVDRADDGMQIRLTKGDVIVNAAKQSPGRHLYVKTKDVSVAVVGTVFLVNAEEAGSRVAVIEGEVHVEQGATKQSLMPGEQMASNASAELPLLSEEIAWSRRAQEHLALLEKSATPTGIVQSTEGPAAFEVISIREVKSTSSAVGRGGRPESDAGCGGIPPQIDQSRFAATTSVYVLIAWAYGKDCHTMVANDLLNGGPDWIKSARFDIQGTLPAGSPAYTRHEFVIGGAPKLRQMLQSLLADRFKLAVHREMREKPVYALTVGKGGLKVKPFLEGSCVNLDPESRPPSTGPSRETYCGTIGPSPIGGGKFGLSWNGVNLEEFARLLSVALNSRPVIDKTGIKGTFDGHLEFAPDESTISMPRFLAGPGGAALDGPTIFTAVQEQLGLKLESAKGPVEALIIDHVERPREN
jgi:uncharacterized protein (TIGR03435 family)